MKYFIQHIRNVNHIAMFKKIMITIFMFSVGFLLIGCEKNDTLKIIVPYGSPEYATLYLAQMNAYEVDVINGADPLVAAFGSDTYDVIIAPTNLGSIFYQSSENYRLACSIVWGNYYLMSHDPFTLESLNDHVIYTFGQNQTPDIILKYILSESQVEPSLTYLTSTVEISAQFLQNEAGIYMVAEPSLSYLMASSSDIYTIDMQELYKDFTGESSYPQASVFVRSSLDDEALSTLKTNLEISINMINNEANLSQTASLLNSDLSLNMLNTSIERSHLKYVDASEAMDAVNQYFEIILANHAALIGGALPKNSFYW